MSAMASQITSVSIVYSTACSGTDQRKHQSSASLAFLGGIHRWPVNSPHKWPITRKMFPLDDVIMKNATSFSGNLLSIIAMRRRRLRRFSTCTFLSAVAVMDSVNLVFYGGTVLIYSFTDIEWSVYLGCKVHPFLTFWCSETSAWLLVCTAVDRYLHAKYPLRNGRKLYVNYARRVSFALALVLALINFPTLIFYNILNDNGILYCGIDLELYEAISIIWPCAASLLYCYIPALLILIFNILIIRYTWIARKSIQCGAINALLVRTSKHISAMLITMAVTFVTLAVPVVTYFMWAQGRYDVESPTWAVTQLLYTLNHSINFYLYCASATIFRRELKKIFGCYSTVHPVNVFTISRHLARKAWNKYDRARLSHSDVMI